MPFSWDHFYGNMWLEHSIAMVGKLQLVSDMLPTNIFCLALLAEQQYFKLIQTGFPHIFKNHFPYFFNTK